MSFVAMNCAVGEPAPATLQAASTVVISPADDSVDTNAVIIQGSGTINSFGPSQHTVVKRVTFQPTGGSIMTLVHSAALSLLGTKNRDFNSKCFGDYQCDGNGHWTELSFEMGSFSSADAFLQIAALQNKVAELDYRVSVLETPPPT